MVDNPSCPVCGARGLPIVRGLPGPEVVEAADRGELIIGGCCLGLDPFGDPHWQCSESPGHRWGREALDDTCNAAIEWAITRRVD